MIELGRVILSEESVVNLFKGILSGVTAVILADFVLLTWQIVRISHNSKATGLGALAALQLEVLLSPLL